MRNSFLAAILFLSIAVAMSMFAAIKAEQRGFSNGLDTGRFMQSEQDQKLMIDLECAHYDPKTAVFTTNSCALPALMSDAVAAPEPVKKAKK